MNLVLLLAVAAAAAGGAVGHGVGVWDLLVGGGEKGERPREVIHAATTPFREAFNVLPVLALVVLRAGFPQAWDAIFGGLYPLLVLGLLGLVLRAVILGFRMHSGDVTGGGKATVIFGAASFVAPFCFSAVLGAISSGRVGAGLSVWATCVNPTSLAFGLLGVAVTALCGAVFLAGDASRQGAQDLEQYFRNRVMWTGITTLVLGVGALVVMDLDSTVVLGGMFTVRAFPFAWVALLATVGAATLFWQRAYRSCRLPTVAGIGCYAVAWGLALYPYLLPGH
ncbi:MAG: cytochrome d ubiquinol oxidase subunit II, partial [Candidatus Dormibacteraeota bacterium]|nr:cytochrome d ubiquinol oxidase subunit II [Candidatus Dormibacteraeota bacterium]